LVNQLDVETYLRGMGEVPSSWPIEAIAAQTVAARTYALRAMSFSGELCDYDLCQVYIGADRETAGQNAAVDETAGQVVTYGGALASTVYSADAGGITATTQEGFGSPDGVYPYLTVVRYNTPDPLPWRSEVALSDLASRFSYSGAVTGVRVSQPGPSGRALQVTLDGSNGPVVVDGRQFAARLGLRSTLFQPTIGTDATAPPPPPDGGVLQALPDDAASLRQAALTGQTAAVLNTASLEGMRDWGNSLLSGAHKNRAVDLATNPATWVALLLVALATALGVREYGFEPAPFALQLADRRTWPVPWRDPWRKRTASRRARPEPDPFVEPEPFVEAGPSVPEPPAEFYPALDWTPLFATPDAERPAL
jgi:SpoIID/LytB domain protein